MSVTWTLIKTWTRLSSNCSWRDGHEHRYKLLNDFCVEEKCHRRRPRPSGWIDK